MDTILGRPALGSARGLARRSAGPGYPAHARGSLSPVGRLLALALTWQERTRQRQALARMDDRMLKDIGLSRADVFLEARKPFWQA